MTAPERVWIDIDRIWHVSGVDEFEGSSLYVRADLYQALAEINESQAAEIARLMKPR